MRPRTLTAEEISRVLSDFGRLGGQRRAATLSKARQREIARQAAKARWKDHKKKIA